MFIVVTHTPCKKIKWTVVRVGLLFGIEDVMFGNEVTSHRMHPATDECGEDQISKRLPAPKVNHGEIKSYLNDEVDELPGAWGLWFEKQWTKSIEEELEDNPYGF